MVKSRDSNGARHHLAPSTGLLKYSFDNVWQVIEPVCRRDLLVFDMAAVLKSKVLAVFKTDMPVTVHWKLFDKPARTVEGDGKLSH
jgi:hypothetical protein